MVNKAKQLKKEERKKDREWRKIIVDMFASKCLICESTKYPNAHHIIPKNFKETRWDVRNGVILCPLHHKFGNFSAHKHPLWFINWLKRYYETKYYYLSDKVEEQYGLTN